MRGNYCRSGISLQEPLPHSLCTSLDLHGILAIVWTPAYSVVSTCVCWPPKRRVCNITSSSPLHRKYLLLLCCLLKVSQYQLTLIDTTSVHIVKGIFRHVHNTVTVKAAPRHRSSCYRQITNYNKPADRKLILLPVYLAQRWAGAMVCFPLSLPTFSCFCRSPDEASVLALLSLYPKQVFSHPGDALRRSPLLFSNITAVTFRRRFNSYIDWDY